MTPRVGRPARADEEQRLQEQGKASVASVVHAPLCEDWCACSPGTVLPEGAACALGGDPRLGAAVFRLYTRSEWSPC